MNSVNDRLREDEAESKAERDTTSNIVINAVGMAHGTKCRWNGCNDSK